MLDGTHFKDTIFGMGAIVCRVYVAFCHFSSVCHSVALLFSMSLLNSISWSSCCCSFGFAFYSFFFLLSLAPHTFTFFGKVLRLDVLLTGTHSLCLFFGFFFFQQQIQLDCVIRVLLLSHNAFSFVCRILKYSLAMRLAPFVDNHKIAKCLLLIK